MEEERAPFSALVSRGIEPNLVWRNRARRALSSDDGIESREDHPAAVIDVDSEARRDRETKKRKRRHAERRKEEERGRAMRRKGETEPEQIRFRRRSTVELTAFRRRVNPFISVAPFYTHVRQFPSVSPRGLLLSLFFDPLALFLSLLSCDFSRRNFRLPLIVLSPRVPVYLEDLSRFSRSSRERKPASVCRYENGRLTGCFSLPCFTMLVLRVFTVLRLRLAKDVRRNPRSQVYLVNMARNDLLRQLYIKCIE